MQMSTKRCPFVDICKLHWKCSFCVCEKLCECVNVKAKARPSCCVTESSLEAPVQQILQNCSHLIEDKTWVELREDGLRGKALKILVPFWSTE